MSIEERKVKQSEHKKELIKYIGTCALVSVVVIVLLLVGFGLENSSLSRNTITRIYDWMGDYRGGMRDCGRSTTKT